MKIDERLKSSMPSGVAPARAKAHHNAPELFDGVLTYLALKVARLLNG